MSDDMMKRLMALDEDCLMALESAAADLVVRLTAEVRVLNAEVERLKGVLAEIADLEDNRSDEAAGTARRALEAKP